MDRTGTLGATVVSVPLLFAAACSTEPKNLFVLLKNDDGTVGSIQVSNAKGSQVLTETGQATGMDSAEAPPQEPFALTRERIDANFKSVIEAQPEQPVTFLFYFKTGTADLTDESKRQINDVMATIQRRRVKPRIAIIGHTDRVGSAAANQRLSLQRAEEVKDLLFFYGIDTEAVEVTSHGESNPLVPTPDDVAEPRNRRVEITVR